MEENKNKDSNYSFGSNIKLYKAIDPNIVTTNKGVLYFNADAEDNAYLSKLTDLFVNGSSVHSNFISLKKNLIYGDSLVSVSGNTEFKVFMEKVNKAGDTGVDIFEKMCLDFALFEAATIQVVYDSENRIAAWYHTDTSDVRAEEPDAFGRVQNWLLSKNWADISNKANRRSTEKNKAVRIPTFNPATGSEDGVQLLYIRRYVSGSQVYAIPSYNSAINWIQLDHELSKFELNKVSKGFFPSGILYLNGDPDDEQKKTFKNNFERKYMGSDKEKILYVWGTGENDRPEFIRTEADKNDTLFNDLNAISAQKIATGHGGNLALAGIEGTGVDLGGDANRLNTSLGWYQKTVIRPMQDTLISGLNKVFDVNDMGKVDVNYTPLDVNIDSDVEPMDKKKVKEIIK